MGRGECEGGHLRRRAGIAAADLPPEQRSPRLHKMNKLFIGKSHIFRQ